MTRTILSAVMMTVLSVGFETESADPVEVTIVFSDGGRMDGEILALRDSSMVVTNTVGISLIELERRPECTFLIAHSQIRSIRTAGGSYTAIGLLSGMALGCVSGCVIGETKRKVHTDSYGCTYVETDISDRIEKGAIGGLIGSVAGAGIGHVASGGRSLISERERDFGLLRAVARYPGPEPDVLKSIVP